MIIYVCILLLNKEIEIICFIWKTIDVNYNYNAFVFCQKNAKKGLLKGLRLILNLR